MNHTNPVASITLHNNTGKSDKIYQCDVVPSGHLYLVNTLTGRRGGSMTPRTKTKVPVSLDQALKNYNAVIREKRADTLDLDVGLIHAPAAADRALVFAGHLLNERQKTDSPSIYQRMVN